VSYLKGVNLDRQHPSCCLRGTNLRDIDPGIADNSQAREPGNQLLEKVHVFPAQVGEVEEHPRHVPTRPREALHEVRDDRVGFEIDGDNGDCVGRLLGGPNRVSTPGEDDADVSANQLRGRSGKQLRSVPRVSVLEDDGLSFYVAALSKCGEEGVPVLRRRLEVLVGPAIAR
jgi:hypothetical protein